MARQGKREQVFAFGGEAGEGIDSPISKPDSDTTNDGGDAATGETAYALLEAEANRLSLPEPRIGSHVSIAC